jgi:NDP-sugar pyrophosphorylase family protein
MNRLKDKALIAGDPARKALVLCGGYGTRLGDLTADLPKPMLPIGDRPLLAHILCFLAHYGYERVAINLHHKPEAITGFFALGERYGVRLSYLHEETLSGTAGILKRLGPFADDLEQLLVLYGDLLLDLDLNEMLAFHHQRAALATILVHQRSGSNSLVQLDNEGRVTGFHERPSEAERAAHAYPWTNSGVQIVNRRLMALIPEYVPCDLPRDVYMPLHRQERIFGLPLAGYRCAIDSPARYAEAQAAFNDGRYVPYPRTS